MKCGLALRETLWSMVSEITSALDSTSRPIRPPTLTAYRAPRWPPAEDGHDELPGSSKVVVIGGGIVGCSVAYHLGKMGWSRSCCWSARS
jgi:NADPH-dependent 2,4-dienoyl-CoA reductase/sulfur reductase-like enzyme